MLMLTQQASVVIFRKKSYSELISKRVFVLIVQETSMKVSPELWGKIKNVIEFSCSRSVNLANKV